MIHGQPLFTQQPQKAERIRKISGVVLEPFAVGINKIIHSRHSNTESLTVDIFGITWN